MKQIRLFGIILVGLLFIAGIVDGFQRKHNTENKQEKVQKCYTYYALVNPITKKSVGMMVESTNTNDVFYEIITQTNAYDASVEKWEGINWMCLYFTKDSEINVALNIGKKYKGFVELPYKE